jgi:(2Fe-2S) ferredoxin
MVGIRRPEKYIEDDADVRIKLGGFSPSHTGPSSKLDSTFHDRDRIAEGPERDLHAMGTSANFTRYHQNLSTNPPQRFWGNRQNSHFLLLVRPFALCYDAPMSQFEKHVFVCTHGPYCWYDGDVDTIFMELKRRVSKAGLKDSIRINRSGCLNQCGHGPMVVVYPDGVWYGGVQVEDIDELFERHLLQGDVVERLCFVAPPGNNKQTRGYPDQVHTMKQVEKSLDEQRIAARRAARDAVATQNNDTRQP